MAELDPTNPPMAEPGRRPQGADVGGMAASADRGLADSLQRSQEQGDDDATGAATTGQGGSGGGPRVDLGGKQEPGSATGAPAPSRRDPADPSTGNRSGAGDTGPGSRSTGRGDRSGSTEGAGGSSRPPHERDEPRDESAVESFGRSISEVVTGSDEEIVEDVRKPR